MTFLIFFVFEIVPTILVLILFGSVQATSLGMFSRNSRLKGGHKIAATNGVLPSTETKGIQAR
jgi:hypothetical protein